MTDVHLYVAHCAHCAWVDQFVSDSGRFDQLSYVTIWQHLTAAHDAEARALRKLSIRERKEAVASWTITTG